MSEVTRTVVVPSTTLTKRELEVFRELEEMYREILIELVDYGRYYSNFIYLNTYYTPRYSIKYFLYFIFNSWR